MSRGEVLEVGPQALELGDGRRLKLLTVIGKGGMSTVYRALLCAPNDVRRLVAVKLFPVTASDEADQVHALLVHTARRVACIQHPNVTRVYECGMSHGRAFLVTELVEGVTLSALQEVYAARQRRMPLDLALFIGCEVGEGLAGARLARGHDGVQLGILHHSVSARDVLLSWRGEVKVSDFELSTSRVATSSVRSLRGVASRATAMAPEIAQGSPGDARSDVFAFGVLLRELLIGPRFPAGLSNADAIRLARQGYVQPLTFQPHLPEGLVNVMLRALELEPDQRYPNACAMASELRRVALAMGVGDGRWFLRAALQREWADYAEEVTAERPFPTPRPDQGGEVFELKRRR